MPRENRALRLARNELKRALREKNPTKVAVACAKIMANDPANLPIFLCINVLMPFVARAVRARKIQRVGRKKMRILVKKELEKIEKKHKVKLSPEDRRMIISATIRALCQDWLAICVRK